MQQKKSIAAGAKQSLTDWDGPPGLTFQRHCSAVSRVFGGVAEESRSKIESVKYNI